MKIGLVLGAGAMRGLAHIGVLQVLEEERIPVDVIVGCSIGGLIGSLYCSGHSPATIQRLAQQMKPKYWMDFVLPKMGLLSGERILATLRLLTKRQQIQDLPLPFAVIATDLQRGEEVIFTEGDIALAVRASLSIPGVFVPVRYQNRLLVDGAVLNPTPIDVARQLGADKVIAVDLTSGGYQGKISTILDVMLQSIDIMECELLKYRQPFCEVLIQPTVQHIPPSSLAYTEETILAGREAAQQHLPQIKQLLL